MGLGLKAPFGLERLEGAGAILVKVLSACLILLVLYALFFGHDVSDNSLTKVLVDGANALELDVIEIDHVIARQFNLPGRSGVLVNDIPRGKTRKLFNIKRGDVILSYNNNNIQSPSHLRHLMSQSRAGDTVVFGVWRRGRTFFTSAKLPISAGVAGMPSTAVFNIAVVLAIIIVTFAALFFNLLNRVVTIVLGATLMLVAGSYMGFYSQAKAFDSIRMSPILIFVGMSVFSIVLEKEGFFDYLAKSTIIKMKGDLVKIVFALCMITYLFSLFANNLSTIIVMIPITLYVCQALNINPLPLIITEIIASNIGGASTMIGDFPNMLISSSTGLAFFDFIIFMFPICLVLLMSLFWYMKRYIVAEKGRRRSSALKKASLQKIKDELEKADINQAAIKMALVILLCVIISFIVLPVFRIKIATIALAGGFILLALQKGQAMGILRRINIADIVFFIALFIIVGGALHSGLLREVSGFITSVSGGHRLVYLLMLMWSAALFTAFLNAGPATALFLPIIMHSHFAGTSDIVWWALSLGVLAGSSATITGATGGIVTQTILEENKSFSAGKGDKRLLTFKNYSSHAIPVAVIFLLISSAYIVFLSSIKGLWNL
jgi:Na+/H+ antiporter NhaD/arsenite permease-like protein